MSLLIARQLDKMTFEGSLQPKPFYAYMTNKLETSINNIYDTRNSII